MLTGNAGPGMLVEMKMPCTVSYLPPKCRKPRQSLVWKQARLSIAAPDVSEARSAFRVATTALGQETPTSYEIRSFDGRLWWPVLDEKGLPTTAATFMKELAAGRHGSLNLLNPAWVFFGGHQSAYDELLARVGYRILNDRSDACLTEAQRGAARIIFCGDVVYGLGGPPVFFGCRAHGSADGAISLRIGSVPPVIGRAGPNPAESDSAQFDGLVFDPASLHHDLALLRSKGNSIDLVDRIEILAGDLALDNEALRVSANGVVRRLFDESTDILAYCREIVPSGSLETSELLPLATCREILIGVAERTWPEDPELAGALSWAAIVEQRLRLIPRPPLAADDDDALGSLGP